MKIAPLSMLLHCWLLTVVGCQASRSTGPYASSSNVLRDSAKADELACQALDVMETDPTEAERLFRSALDHDLFHGPAHNNLGVLLLAGGHLYEAAHEFEWARKLMPGHPDPRVNLGLVLDEAGKAPDAIASFRSALEVRPGHLPAMQGLARSQVRANLVDSDTIVLLDAISLQSTDPSWRSWALRERLKHHSRGSR